jgi:F420-dependent oxidoreductase-like protein
MTAEPNPTPADDAVATEPGSQTPVHAKDPITRFGLQLPSFTFPGVPDSELFERIAASAVAADESGFDSLWVMDHLYQITGVGAEDEPMLEAYTLLGALGAVTSRVQLGTMVTGVTYRNPALLAKTITTLDLVSSGRAILGIGAAWNTSEHEGYGYDFPSARERLDRLEEAVQICRGMLTEERPTFHGKYYRTERALNRPRPVRPGGPPILIGGGGEQRTLRLVAKYADACNVFGDPAGVRHKLDVLERHCTELGRDRKEITATALLSVAVSATAEEADAKAARISAARGMDEAAYRARFVSGTVEQVGARLAEYFRVGLDGVLVNLPDAQDTGAVRLAGEALNRAGELAG